VVIVIPTTNDNDSDNDKDARSRLVGVGKIPPGVLFKRMLFGYHQCPFVL